MPNLSKDELLGLRYLEILEEAFASGTADGIREADIDDTNGRVTGKWECAICGARFAVRDCGATERGHDFGCCCAVGCCGPLFRMNNLPVTRGADEDAVGPDRKITGYELEVDFDQGSV